MEYRKKTKKQNFIQWFNHSIVAGILIWLPFLFIMITDILCEIYQRVSFPIYGIKIVDRNQYIQVFDREKLQYLSFIEKIGCAYCGYINGCLLFLKEIAGQSEKYWCGIMHADKKHFLPQEYQSRLDFAEYNDEKGFKKRYD
jgi:hypothetical protein